MTDQTAQSKQSEQLEQALEAFRTCNRINLLLIDTISAAGMRCTLSTRGGRDVARQFAHIHNNRYWQLEKRAKDLIVGLHKFETKDQPTKKQLKDNLNQSCARIEEFLTRAVTGEGKARTFKKGPIVHLGYLIAHESHHRGSILLTLKQSGHKLDQDTSYGIWDWDRL